MLNHCLLDSLDWSYVLIRYFKNIPPVFILKTAYKIEITHHKTMNYTPLAIVIMSGPNTSSRFFFVLAIWP